MSMKFMNEDTGVLTEAIFCFTGKSPKTRVQMEQIAIQAGGSVTKSITGKTTILVIADATSNSSKARKARSNGIDLISPSQFFLICSHVDKKNSVDKVSQISVKKPNQKTRHSLTRRIEL